MFYAIDVSKWQGAVNWASVKAAGVRHAMLRAGYGSGTVDPQFKRNAAQCTALGVDWAATGTAMRPALPRPGRRPVAACR